MPDTYSDLLNYLRYSCRYLGADELITFIWPQLFSVADAQLSADAFPDLLNLNRTSLTSEGLYIIFNTFYCYLWVGSNADPFFTEQLFGDGQSPHDEETIFFTEEQQAKAWVQELQALIQACRVSQ